MSKTFSRSIGLVVSLALLGACNSDSDETSVAPTATGLSGSVAVGVPMTQGKLRIVDATGAVIAEDIAIDANGAYSIPTLTGTAPWRLEACGYAGANYECIYSVAQAAGSANVTPLTTATVLLAANQQPGSLMTGAATGLGQGAIDTAQGQLRTGLASVLNGNVANGFDFITGELTAGSRSGYDRVLDAIGVATGEDAGAFVQITPRQGSGNLYLQTGQTSGTVTADTQAGTLPLNLINGLFSRMTAKVASANACQGPNGLATEMAANARIDGDGEMITGAQDVADLFCGYLAEAGAWGSTFLNPTLGRCVVVAGDARCKVGFDVQMTDGSIQPFASGMGVQLVGGVWKFMGSIDPVAVRIDARVQRQTRIDGVSVAPNYMRALSIEVSRVPGLACAKATQAVAGGASHTFAILKAYDNNASRLSVWRANPYGTEASLDVFTGFVRNSDDSWYVLPEGTTGDDVVRNFFRNGRGVVVSLFQDAACTTPLVVENVSTIEVEIEGVPPVSASLPTFPWPELTPAAITAVNGTTLAANSSGSVALAWAYPNGRAGVNGVTFCGSLAQCGDQDDGRFGARDIPASTMSISLPLQSHSLALGASRTVALYGTGPGGIFMQSNFTACGGAGDHCQ